MGLEDKLVALGELGLDAVLVMKYSLELASLTPEEFVATVLVDTLKASHVVIGHDARFGRGNSGDLATMQELGKKLGFEVLVISEFGSEGFPIHDDAGTDRRCSSTWVREALREGDVATAAAVLGQAAPDARRSGPRRRTRPRSRLPHSKPRRRRRAATFPRTGSMPAGSWTRPAPAGPPPSPSAPTPRSTA